MFDKKTHDKLVELYSIPHVDEVIFSDGVGLPPMKCWKCHHRPCVCEKFS